MCAPDNIAVVREAIEHSPHHSLRPYAASLNISYTSVRQILHEDLHFHPFEVQILHTLNDNDNANCINFCCQLLQLLEGQKELIHNIFMCDEVHFHLSRYEYKNNSSYWSDSNTDEQHEEQLHSAKVAA